MDNKWIKLYEQTPPVNKEVEVKFIENGKEKIHYNKLIPLMNGKYIWAYCDYDNCDEVVAWRYPSLMKIPNLEQKLKNMGFEFREKK